MYFSVLLNPATPSVLPLFGGLSGEWLGWASGDPAWLQHFPPVTAKLPVRTGHAAIPSTGGSGGRPRIMSDAFSAIIIVEL
jgi:hypothetical protein